MNPFTAYTGTSRRLILALDVGTTFSGISYCILNPGDVPEIKGVTKFPDQALIRGDSKVPSIIWYGTDGTIKAIGERAVDHEIEEEAMTEGWQKVEWFKLHLRPKSLGKDDVSTYLGTLPPLPVGKSVLDVLSDYLRFLYQCTEAYIIEHHPMGENLWKSLVLTTEFILSHPNGWEGLQQRMMRQAAVLAGLVNDEIDGDKRVYFVTEGEASLQFCIWNNLAVSALNAGHSAMVIDAGGGTIDISAFRQRKVSDDKVSYEEVSIPKCYLHGSMFVSRSAEAYLKDYLKGTEFSNDVSNMAEVFDKTTKHKFHRSDQACYIKFGSQRDNNRAKSIRAGVLTLPGDVVATLFQPALDCIINTILEHCKESELKTVFLVGGFSANDWLFHQTKQVTAAYGIDVCRPESHVSKAVTDGAVVHRIAHAISGSLVLTRKAKFAYGTDGSVLYHQWKRDHFARRHSVYRDHSGLPRLPGAFQIILSKGASVSEAQEFRSSFNVRKYDKHQLTELRAHIYIYRGDKRPPDWMNEDAQNFEQVCHIVADATNAASSLKPKAGDSGKEYYQLNFDIILLFGLIELQAQIAWIENDVEKSIDNLQLMADMVFMCNSRLGSQRSGSAFTKAFTIVRPQEGREGGGKVEVVA